MTYAIVEVATKSAVIADNGYPHIYSSKEYAEKVFSELFAGREGFRVQPW